MTLAAVHPDQPPVMHPSVIFIASIAGQGVVTEW